MKRIAHSLLILLLFPVILSAQSGLDLSHPPGSYNKDILLRIEPGDSRVNIYYSFDGEQIDTRIPYTFPLYLSSIPGEERRYTITVWAEADGAIIEQSSLEYILDKRVPDKPVLSKPGGVYPDDIILQFNQPSDDEEIIYSLNTPIARAGKVWNGDPFKLTAKTEEDTIYVLNAYSKDRAGNTSLLISRTFTIRKKVFRAAETLSIISPVQGDYANTQMFLVRTEGFNWIRYTYDGSDPASSGITYTGPVEIPRTGSVTVRIAAQSSSSGSIFTREIQYSVTPVSNIRTNVDNGIFTDTLTVELEGDNTIYYTLDDSSPSSEDLLYTAPFELKPLRSSRKTVILRFSSYSRITSRLNEHRYVLIFDDRKPLQPEISAEYPSGRDDPLVITMSGPSGADMFYTLDGSAPTTRSDRYTEPIEIPGTVYEEKTLEVKGIASYPNGRTSSAAGLTIASRSDRPVSPGVSAVQKQGTQDMLVAIEHPGETVIVYELSFRQEDRKVPTLFSPVCQDQFTVSVPYGMERTFYFTFAALDRQGIVSEPVEFKLSIDRKPPPAPSVGYDNGILKLAGEGAIYYSITDDNSIPPVPDKNAVPYTGLVYLFGERTES